jgi:hypothetical protein
MQALRLVVSLAVSAWALCAAGATLEVGPGKPFARPSAAFQAAHDGDTILIDAAGNYAGDVCIIRPNGLTVRGVGPGRAKLPANGRDAGGKAIWVTAGSDFTAENIEFSGARVRDRNGAGIRAEGKNLTLRNCRFYQCENGILGGNGEMLIERCSFEHCSLVATPAATHSLYIGERCTKLTFRDNYSTFAHEAHLLKTRARESWILYNRLTDEEGTGSAVADFPNGGLVVLVGNILHKGANAQNTRVIAYGFEGLKHPKNALYVVNNTMVYEHRRPNAFFVHVLNTPADFVPVIGNNLCIGKIPLTNAKTFDDLGGNLLFKTAAEAGVVDAARYDYHLAAGSPCLGKGVAVDKVKVDGFDLTPKFQYVHPCKLAARRQGGPMDVGAFARGE